MKNKATTLILYLWCTYSKSFTTKPIKMSNTSAERIIDLLLKCNLETATEKDWILFDV